MLVSLSRVLQFFSGRNTEFVSTLAKNTEIEDGMEDEVENEVEDKVKDGAKNRNINESLEEASSKAGFEVFEFIRLARDLHSDADLLLPSQV
jgi:hypothetical protein